MSKRIEILRAKYAEEKVVDCGNFLVMYIKNGPLHKLLIKEMVCFLNEISKNNKCAHLYERIYRTNDPLRQMIGCLKGLQLMFKVFYYKESADVYVNLFNIDGYPALYLNKGKAFTIIKSLFEGDL